MFALKIVVTSVNLRFSLAVSKPIVRCERHHGKQIDDGCAFAAVAELNNVRKDQELAIQACLHHNGSMCLLVQYVCLAGNLHNSHMVLV
jgi:hypothetical protein